MNRHKLVMIIDDVQIDRIIAQRVVAKYGFAEQTVAFEGALDALKHLRENENNMDLLPDVIFLDINMPEMNGFDFLDQYNLISENLKKKSVIIMLTSSLLPEDMVRAQSSPYVQKFISKPLNEERLKSLEKISGV